MFTDPRPDPQRHINLYFQQDSAWRYHAGSWLDCGYKIQGYIVTFVKDIGMEEYHMKVTHLSLKIFNIQRFTDVSGKYFPSCDGVF